MSLAIAAVLLAQQASAFGTQRTHEELAREALRILRSNGQFSHYLSDNLGLSQGVDERLAIQIGLVPELDPQLATELVSASPKPYYEGRLNKGQSALEEVDGEWVAFPDAPKGVFYRIPGSCRGQSDFDACFQGLERVDIGKLIRIGTYAEDNPNPRSKHHFHDPERSHGLFPAGNHGLDNSKPFLLGLDAFVAEATTLTRGGSLLRGLGGILLAPLEALPGVDFGNFALEGRSAVDRALNTPRSGSFPSDQHPDNRFSLPDAERYLYLALGSPEKDLREHYLALHFVAFGHALHLLQDMASVAHTRNDFIFDHVKVDQLFGETSLEAAGDKPEVFANVLKAVGAIGLASHPKLHLASTGTGSGNLSDYLDAQAPLDPTGFDVADFWDRAPFDAPNDADPGQAGLAERVHNRFFSAGSISNSALLNGYELPRIPACDTTGASAGTGSDRTWIANLPQRALATGGRVDDPALPDVPFVSSPLVPHLARCRLHEIIAVSKAGGAPSGVQHRWGPTVVDESVQRDYLELLFPLVIEYTAKFMEFYFQPRIEVVPTGLAEFKLRNLTPLELRASANAVEIVYETEEGSETDHLRERVAARCGSGEIVLPPKPSAGEVAPLGEVVCTLPDELSKPARNRTDFWVVVRGKLGERGAVASADAFDGGDEDFVVAFDHVRPLALFSRTTVDPEGAPGDGSQQIDVFELPIDETLDLSAPGAVAPAPVNLTAALRDETGIATLDFLLPATWPTGSNIALRSDRGAPAHEYFPNLDAAADVFVLDRSRGVVDSAGLTGPLALSRQFEPESTLTEMTPAWSRDGQALFAFEDGPSGGADRLVRHDLPPPPAAPTPTGSTRLVQRVASHSIDADPNDPPLDLGTERDTCEGVGLPSALDRRALAVVAECFQEQVVIGPGSLRVWEQVGPRVHRIRIASVAAGPNGDGELAAEYTARLDFGASQLAPCADASCADPGSEPAGEENASETFPSLSPDGAQLAFVRDPDALDAEHRADLYVMSALGSGGPRLVLPRGIGRISSVDWSPDGRWLLVRVDDDAGAQRDLLLVDPDPEVPPVYRQISLGADPESAVRWYGPLVLPGAP